MPKELRNLKEDAPADVRAKAAEWRAIHCWHPNQLRHTAATLIRAKADLDTARTVLGHSSTSVTEIYAERDLATAKKVIKKIG